jgi:hypothetical protein
LRVNIAIPEAHVKKPVLDGALEAVTRLNEELIRSGESPTSDQLIKAGARWQPEKPGAEHFDHGALIASRGHGDCDDWAPLHAATLRVTGEDPGATAVVRKSGPKRWHAIVRRSDGTIDDPSLAAGMPGPGAVHGVRGATLPLMYRAPTVHGVEGSYIATPQLALRPVADRHGQVESWQARADLPWHWRPGSSPADVAMVSLHRSPVSSQAIVGAVMGAWRLGVCSGEADPDHLARLAAISDACEGCPFEELEERYGTDHANAAAQVVGSFFGKAFRGIKKLAKKAVMPLAKTALSFIPGGNIASMALSAASPLLKKNVAKAQHLPPAQRAAALTPPAQPRAAPPPQRLGPAPSHGPVIVRQADPNVPLINLFAGHLQRAYEFRGAPSAQPQSKPRGASPGAIHRPPAAWPR